MPRPEVEVQVTTTTTTAPVWSTSIDLDVRNVDTTFGPIEVATCGSGPAVLLIHGIPGSWRQCVPLAEDIAATEATDGFKVILPSRPGYGRTPVTVGRSYEDQADAFAALLDALGIEKAAVLGISGGGPIAVALAQRHHERVSALVMACAMAPHLTKVPPAMRLVRIPWLAEFLGPRLRERDRQRVADPAAVDTYLRASLTPQEYASVEAEPQVRDDLLRHSLGHLEAPAGISGQRNDLAAVLNARRHAQQHGVPSYDKVSCPVLLMYGECDGVIPMTHARYYAEALPSAELVSFENAGHVFALTRRGESSAAIRAFFERNS
jgi:pimeloyl-ACP methyl ester carboxylesterase